MGISQFFIMFLTNVLEQLRQVKRNVMLLLVPVFVFTFMYLFFSLNKVEEAYIEPLTIGVIVEEESTYAGLLADSFLSYDAFTGFVTVKLGDNQSIFELFNGGELDAVLEVPEGFVDAVMQFSYNPVKATVNYRDPLKATLIKEFLIGYESYITSAEVGIMTLYDEMERNDFSYEDVKAYNEVISYDLIFTALNRHELFLYHEVVDIPTVGSLAYFLIAIMVMFLMYIALFAAINLMRERAEYCLERIRITKVSLISYIGSKVLAITVFIFLMVMVWWVFYGFVSNEPLAMNMGGMLGFLFVAILFDVSLAVLISSFFTRDESVVLFSSVFIFINALIGGSIIPLHIMPNVIGKLGTISPNLWMIRGFLYYMSNKNVSEANLIMWVLLLVSVIMCVVAGSNYSRKRV